MQEHPCFFQTQSLGWKRLGWKKSSGFIIGGYILESGNARGWGSSEGTPSPEKSREVPVGRSLLAMTSKNRGDAQW